MPDGVGLSFERSAAYSSELSLRILNQEKSSANSIYHALQTSLRVSNWHGLTSQANFVWSHSIDTASDLEDFHSQPGAAAEQHNPAGDRGNSSFDIRRRFTWNFTYEFPKMGGNLSKLKNGWGWTEC